MVRAARGQERPAIETLKRHAHRRAIPKGRIVGVSGEGLACRVRAAPEGVDYRLRP
ncbi:MAG: hypothetical protein JNL84_14770 [Candidatus Accumulibacter sp.]|nr:hypothetical protein [Accumulibacter sp.]